MFYGYLPYLTITGPCPISTSPLSPISQVQDPVLQLPQYITSTRPFNILKSPISQLLNSALPVSALYHTYWAMSCRFIPCITSTRTCPTGINFPISQVLDPVLPLRPLYHKYWHSSKRYIPYITGTVPCPTGISQYNK